MTGFVTFVSSGPGDPELLTVKAVKALAVADAVLFDDLSSGPILALARPGADMVGVGKRAGRASPKQDHVSRLLVDYALTGARVVRLKSGDSGIFGRLEEELTALREAGVPATAIFQKFEGETRDLARTAYHARNTLVVSTAHDADFVDLFLRAFRNEFSKALQVEK